MFSTLFRQKKAYRAKQFVLDEWFEKPTALALMYEKHENDLKEANGVFEAKVRSSQGSPSVSQNALPVYIGTWWPNASAWIHLITKHLFDEWIWDVRASTPSSPSTASRSVVSSTFPGIQSVPELVKVSLGVLNVLLYDVQKECKHVWFANLLEEKMREKEKGVARPKLLHTGSSSSLPTSRTGMEVMLSDMESSISQHSTMSRSRNSVLNINALDDSPPPHLYMSQFSPEIVSATRKSFFHWQKTYLDLSILKLMYSVFSKLNDKNKANEPVRVLKSIIFEPSNRATVFGTLGALSGWYALVSTPLSAPTTGGARRSQFQEDSLMEWDEPYLRWKTLVDAQQIEDVVQALWKQSVEKAKKEGISLASLRAQPCPSKDDPHVDQSILLIRLRSEIEAMQCLVSLSSMMPPGCTLLECFGGKMSSVVVGLVHSFQWRNTSLVCEDEIDAEEVYSDPPLTPSTPRAQPEQQHDDTNSEASDLSDIFPSSVSQRSDRSHSIISTTSITSASRKDFDGDGNLRPSFLRTPSTPPRHNGNSSPSFTPGTPRTPTTDTSTLTRAPVSWHIYYRQLFDRLLMNHLFISVVILDLLITPQNSRTIMEYAAQLKSRYGLNPLVSRLLSVCNLMLDTKQLDSNPLCGKFVFVALNVFITLAKGSKHIKVFEEHQFQQFLTKILLSNPSTMTQATHKALYQSLQVQVLQLIGAQHSVGVQLIKSSEDETNRPVLAAICSLLIQMIPHAHTHRDTVVPLLHFLTFATNSHLSASDLRSILMDWMFKAHPQQKGEDAPQQTWPPKEVASQLSWQSADKIFETYQKKYSVSSATETQQALAEAIDQFFTVSKGGGGDASNTTKESNTTVQTAPMSSCKVS